MSGRSKVAVVTGGSRGRSRNIVIGLARRGVPTIFTSNLASSAARDEAFWVAVEATGLGARAIPLELDFDRPEAVTAFGQQMSEALTQLYATKIDYLVLNAVTRDSEEMETASEEERNRVCGNNLDGGFFVTRALLPLIDDGARIVHRLDRITYSMDPESASFLLLKRAAEILARAIAVDLGPRRIAVDCVVPGLGIAELGALLEYLPDIGARIGTAGGPESPDTPDDLRLTIIAQLTDDGGRTEPQRVEVSDGLTFWLVP